MRKEYIKECDTGRLQQEFYDAIPSLKPYYNESGALIIPLIIFTNGNTLILELVDDVDISAVDTVVANHTTVSIITPEPIDENFEDQISMAVTDLQLKVANLESKVGV